MTIALINPPVAKPGEPPAGLARLSGALSANGIRHHVVDASIEGIYHLLRSGSTPSDTWTRRASRNLSQNLSVLKSPAIYRNMDQYKRAVMDVNRVLARSAAGYGVQISLGDYLDASLTPVKSGDLLHAVAHEEENPFYPYFTVRLSELIEGEGITSAGFSLNYLSQALSAFAMVGFIKRKYPHITIILGGGLITSWMRNPNWKNPFGGIADHLVAGPGEAPLLEIFDKKAINRAYCRPSYDLFPIKDYLSPGFVLPYSTSSGCYWGKCSFCPERAEGNDYVQIGADRVIDDLYHLKEQFNPALIHFTDNALSPAMMKRISGAAPGAPWYGFARITKALADPDYCAALKQSGCVMLKLGLESGSQRVLDYMTKGCDLETASSALEALHAAGIGTYVYLLFGTPAETISEARETLDFIVKRSGQIDFLNLAIFNLPVNSPEAKAVDTAAFYEGDLTLYRDFDHPQAWGRRQVRQFLEKEFKKHPAIQPILQNQPPFFTSNHAPFFLPSMSYPCPNLPGTGR